ncbi:MAG: hypothetical protein JXA33_01650 [Anaerolineae bacterium]|nr:hypothetical protein [Anaerolineae bacterium]
MDPAGHDYRLHAGSPAVDMGCPETGIAIDVNGDPRPEGAGYDIGAFELQTTTPFTPTATVFLPLVTATATPSLVTSGHITYRLGNRLYRLAAWEGATPEDVSAALDTLSAGTGDEWLNISPDGAWLLTSTDRFDLECAGWACLALVKSDFSGYETVRVDGVPLHPPGFSTVASGGALIVYPDDNGPHTRDLWVIRRDGSAWGTPMLLTGDSSYDYNEQPALAADGSIVVFDCSPVPYGQEGTAICKVNTDSSNFHVVLASTYMGGSIQNALRHPDYAPDGSIVFESDWGGERIWRLAVGATTAQPVNADLTNDNSPCVLPDGRVVSLWLNRPGSNGEHEIKVMAADGSSYIMVLTGQDVLDIGIGCGE